MKPMLYIHTETLHAKSALAFPPSGPAKGFPAWSSTSKKPIVEVDTMAPNDIKIKKGRCEASTMMLFQYSPIHSKDKMASVMLTAKRTQQAVTNVGLR
mmetsp:Transcript_11566/g.18811  ORF Transcript_11566/g.18811 Transcript_11566/m.18811 type:complete len:98 (-) Transcript_11566:164-457(-)